MTDAVITWVNASDPKWLNKKRAFMLNSEAPIEADMDSDERYRDYGTLKYLLRSIECNMPWLKNIYLITDDQIPEWLDIENEKLKVIDHTDYMDAQSLPTFNSNAIELNINKIEELDEQFILFNDDQLVSTKTTEADFFVDGVPTDFRIYDTLLPEESFDHIIINNIKIINQLFYQDRKRRKLKNLINPMYGRFMVRSLISSYFPGVSTYYNPHSPQPLLKSTIDRLWQVAEDEMTATSRHHIRDESDINIWLARYLQLETNQFKATTPKRSVFYKLDEIEKIKMDIQNGQHQLLCINDTTTENYEELTKQLIDQLEDKFPNKSQFELN
ncbi:exopolysaccharide phosphotransferase cps2G [Latilactobacillus sakei]|uniref:Stealth CR1 domain-containing protein n=1 Tax=Latilactobacillus sakei TaxID=1599 RepID=UPI001174EDCE|nr:Stealth CR1 domain-containing protein [Latilactobacillus sakei]MDR7925233.1 Stealth CR1 domain-containing protein [Latilactobacillus sakei subsp. sakei]GEA77081.1 exopolysaccharide phosphotransferase cps2G [Latilactobacillus sakei]